MSVRSRDTSFFGTRQVRVERPEHWLGPPCLGGHRPSWARVYVNFLGSECQGRVLAAYGEATFSRLASIKARFDPNNVLRFNQNIPPAA